MFLARMPQLFFNRLLILFLPAPLCFLIHARFKIFALNDETLNHIIKMVLL
ncbi:MAG: hypothetical protein FKGGLIKP_00894 [Sodalis sp. Fse]|nr:MAG: hypothetical protein FKGGLIKP_00894 [Sodalis sp. Fse]